MVLSGLRQRICFAQVALLFVLVFSSVPLYAQSKGRQAIGLVETTIRPICGSSRHNLAQRYLNAENGPLDTDKYYPPHRGKTVPYSAIKRSPVPLPFDTPMCLPGTEPDAYKVSVRGVRPGPDEHLLIAESGGTVTCKDLNTDSIVPHEPTGRECSFKGDHFIQMIVVPPTGVLFVGTLTLSATLSHMPLLVREQTVVSPHYAMDCRDSIELAAGPETPTECDFSGMTISLTPQYLDREPIPDWSFLPGQAATPVIPSGVTDSCQGDPIPGPFPAPTSAPQITPVPPPDTSVAQAYLRLELEVARSLTTLSASYPTSGSRKTRGPSTKLLGRVGTELQTTMSAFLQSLHPVFSRNELAKIARSRNFSSISGLVRDARKGAASDSYLMVLNPSTVIGFLQNAERLRTRRKLPLAASKQFIAFTTRAIGDLVPPGYTAPTPQARYTQRSASVPDGNRCTLTIDTGSEATLESRSFDIMPNTTASLMGSASTRTCEKDNAEFITVVRPTECKVNQTPLCSTQSACLARSVEVGLSNVPPIPTQDCAIAARDFCSLLARRADILEMPWAVPGAKSGILSDNAEMYKRRKARSEPIEKPGGCPIDYPYFPGTEGDPYCARLSARRGSEFLQNSFTAWQKTQSAAYTGLSNVLAGIVWTLENVEGTFTGSSPSWEELTGVFWHELMPYTREKDIRKQVIDWPLVESSIVDPCSKAREVKNVLEGLACIGKRTQLFYESKSNRLSNFNNHGERTDCAVCRHYAGTFAGAAKLYLIRKGLQGRIAADINYNGNHMWNTISTKEGGKEYSYLFDPLNDPMCMELMPDNSDSFTLPKVFFQE